MAETRIDSDDGKNITFHYNNHTNEEYHKETNSAFKFITKSLKYLLPERF